MSTLYKSINGVILDADSYLSNQDILRDDYFYTINDWVEKPTHEIKDGLFIATRPGSGYDKRDTSVCLKKQIANTAEIQLHTAQTEGNTTQVEYSIVGDNCIANVTQHLKNSWLIPIADDLNEYGDRYIGEYFKDHLRKIVTVYLERMLS